MHVLYDDSIYFSNTQKNNNASKRLFWLDENSMSNFE